MSRPPSILNYFSRAIFVLLFLFTISAFTGKKDKPLVKDSHSALSVIQSHAIVSKVNVSFQKKQLPALQNILKHHSLQLTLRLRSRCFVNDECISKFQTGIKPLIFNGLCAFLHLPHSEEPPLIA